MNFTRGIVQDIIVTSGYVTVYLVLDYLLSVYISGYPWMFVIIGSIIVIGATTKIRNEFALKAVTLSGAIITFLGLKEYLIAYIPGSVWVFLVIGMVLYVASNQITDLII